MHVKSGDVVRVGRAASVQFDAERALTFRVIKVSARQTYDGWVWLEGYTLGPTGDALERREIFVRAAGLQLLHRVRRDPDPRQRNSRQPGRSVTHGTVRT